MPLSAAERQRRCRMRQTRRQTALRVEVRDRVIDALIAVKRLTPAEALDKAHVAKEVSAIAEEWAALQVKKTVTT